MASGVEPLESRFRSLPGMPVPQTDGRSWRCGAEGILRHHSSKLWPRPGCVQQEILLRLNILAPMPHSSTLGWARQLARVAPGPVLLWLSMSCSHQDPFPSGHNPPLGPRTTDPPIQLTYAGNDLTPAWFPDGSAIAYTWTSPYDSGGNRCLGVIPAAGGTRHSEKCWPVGLLHDSISSLNWVSVANDGRAAWVDQVSRRRRIPPDRSALRIGILASRDTGSSVRTFPYLSPTGNVHFTGTNLTWLSPTRLAYVGALQDYPNRGADTVVIGIEVVLLDLSQSSAGLTIVPNTAGANSLSASPDGSTIYYTVNGDTRVIQQVLATGDTSTTYDFAAVGLGFPSNISMGGGFLAATVGPASGSPGQLVRVNLTGGTAEPIEVGEDVGIALRSRLSPDGHSLVVQLAQPASTLWLYRLP